MNAGREKSVLRGHPWIFSGSVARAPQESSGEKPGRTVRVSDSNGNFLAWGAISPQSKIRVRVWSQNEAEVVGADFFFRRITAAIDRRKLLSQTQNVNAFRLVHAESDGLPGLIVDKYGQILVVQFLSGGVEFWRDVIVEQLVKITSCEQIYERSDADIRHLEGLDSQKGLLVGEGLSIPVAINEGELQYWVDIPQGQKTGFFLDQRDNRAVVRGLAAKKTVLDCFAYTGGFTIAALVGGAKKATAVEASADAIDLVKENL